MIPEISEETVSSTVSAVKQGFVTGFGKFIKSEMSVDKLGIRRWFQIIIPWVLIVLSIFIMKPGWAVTVADDGTVTYKFIRIIIVSVTIYIITMIALVGIDSVL